METFYIADMHLGHGNIIRFDNRPFTTIQEMEEVFIRNWNERVTAKDRVFIIGDFCWGTTKEWERLLPLFRGQKFLVRGNHDIKHIAGKVAKLLAGIADYKSISDNGRDVYMSHFPQMFYNHSHNPNSYMVCGHVHMTKENDHLEQWRAELREIRRRTGASNCGNIINAGCMMPYMGYTPRTLDEMIEGTGFGPNI